MSHSLIQPSYKSGFARSASESASPDLWRGLVRAWVPALGNTGNQVHDVSGNRGHITLDLTANEWKRGYIDATATNNCASFSTIGAMPEWTVVSKAEAVAAGSNFYNGLIGRHNDTKNAIGWRHGAGRISINSNTYGLSYYDYGGSSEILTGNRELWSWRFENSTRARFQRNDQFNDATSAPNSDFNWGSANRLYEAGTNVGQQTDWESILIYDRWLSDDELLRLNDDYLAPFRRKSRTFWFAGDAPAPSFNPAWAVNSNVLVM